MSGCYGNHPEDRAREAELNRHLNWKREPSGQEIDEAKAVALLATLARKRSNDRRYAGVELVSEAFSEAPYEAFQPIVELLENSLGDRIDPTKVDDAELGRLCKAIIWPYLVQHAESNHEDYLPD